MEDRYVAYVGSYTHGSAAGITILDVDVQNGIMTKKSEVNVNNSSYLIVSHSGRFLYSVVDEGVAAFSIDKDGELTYLATTSIKGMRGCHLSLTKADDYIFVSGYHDGKLTVLRINEDGTVGEITEEIYHKGIGSIAERNFRPHINCSVLTPDEDLLCVCDIGLDQVKVYEFDRTRGKLKFHDLIRCALESAPREITFSRDGHFAYIVCELKNYIEVYEYIPNAKTRFEFVQNIYTVRKGHKENTAAAAIQFDCDGDHLFCSNAGDDSVSIYSVNQKTGELTFMQSLPISGRYPKDINLFPDDKHLVCVNNESGTLTFFTIDCKKGLLVMNGKPLKIDTPNCIAIHKLI